MAARAERPSDGRPLSTVVRVGGALLAAVTLVGLLVGYGWSGVLAPEPEGAQRRVWDEPDRQPDRVVLTWSDDPATTQSVTWRTDTTVTAARAEVALASPHPGFVDAAASVAARTERVDARVVDGEDVVANYHSVTFTGLVPDTLYAYRVGEGDRWSEWFQFRTASTEPEPFSFIYFGDAQNDVLSLWSRTVRASALEAPDARFMIHAGDLINRAHRNTEWGEWFEAGGFLHAMIPSVPTPGNHEHDPYTEEEEARDIERLSIFWRPQFTLPENGPEGVEPETSYWIDYQGVRIISLNSSQDADAQATWLERVLAENDQRWTVVTHHHPIFSASEGRDNEGLRAAWKPLYDRYGVDLVLQGHDHTYARGRTFASAENVPEGVNMRDGETGTVYVVSVSGRKMYDLKTDGWDGYEADRDRAAENTQLFQVIRVEGDRLVYEAFTPTGFRYDAFDLVKQPNRPNLFVDQAPDDPIYTFRNTDPYPW
jgi:3',5'-cyclic AMP phosphodiesterase CpdA